MSKLHPRKIHNSIFGIRFFNKKTTKKFFAYFMVGFLVISSITFSGGILNHSRVLAANSSNKTEANLSNPNDDKVGICIPGLCIKTPPILKPLEKPIQDGINSVVRDKLRSFLSNEIPITGTEHKLYPTTLQVPGGQFTPQTLYLNALNSSQVIPPGDYEIPVHYYCTKVYTLNGAGNRYRLARLNGRLSNVLSTLYQRASLNKVPIQDVQVLSWSIQSGVSYDNLSSSSKQLVNQLIPDYRQQLEGSFTDKTIKYWNSISQVTSLPSFDATLNQLGDIGTFAKSLLRAREEIINTNFNYRSLANAFVIPQDVNLPGGMETTAWSQINEQVYLRFIAPKGALNDGVAQVRILGRSQTKELDKVDLLKSNVESKQVISSLPGNNNRSASSVTAEALLSNISQSVGIPEQNGQALTATVTPAPEGTVATIPCNNPIYDQKAIASVPKEPKNGSANGSGYGPHKGVNAKKGEENNDFHSKSDGNNETWTGLNDEVRASIKKMLEEEKLGITIKDKKGKDLENLTLDDNQEQKLQEILKLGIKPGNQPGNPLGNNLVRLFMNWNDNTINLGTGVSRENSTLTGLEAPTLRHQPNSPLSQAIANSWQFRRKSEITTGPDGQVFYTPPRVREIVKQKINEQIRAIYKNQDCPNSIILSLDNKQFPTLDYSDPREIDFLQYNIGGTQGRALFIKDFKLNTASRKYEIKLQFVFYDDFGVDNKDIYGQFKFGRRVVRNIVPALGKGFKGMQAQWLLQHQGTAKPFVQEIIIEETITDSY